MSSSARSPVESLATTVAIVVVYVVAGAVFCLRLFGGDFTLLSEIWGAAALGIVVAVPATLAVLGRNGRTSLLLPAAVIAFLGSPIVSILFVFLVVAAVVWVWAFVGTSPKGPIWRALVALAVVPVLWFVSAAALFVHLDPVCQETLSDGTVRRVEDVSAFTGWSWNAPPVQRGETRVHVGVIQVACTSDEITPLETAAVALFAAGAIASGMAIVRREEAVGQATIAAGRPRRSQDDR